MVRMAANLDNQLQRVVNWESGEIRAKKRRG
jgi:hypothetical protein